jgi:hypothetical protein
MNVALDHLEELARIIEEELGLGFDIKMRLMVHIMAIHEYLTSTNIPIWEEASN